MAVSVSTSELSRPTITPSAWFASMSRTKLVYGCAHRRSRSITNTTRPATSTFSSGASSRSRYRRYVCISAASSASRSHCRHVHHDWHASAVRARSTSARTAGYDSGLKLACPAAHIVSSPPPSPPQRPLGASSSKNAVSSINISSGMGTMYPAACACGPADASPSAPMAGSSARASSAPLSARIAHANVTEKMGAARRGGWPPVTSTTAYMCRARYGESGSTSSVALAPAASPTAAYSSYDVKHVKSTRNTTAMKSSPNAARASEGTSDDCATATPSTVADAFIDTETPPTRAQSCPICVDAPPTMHGPHAPSPPAAAAHASEGRSVTRRLPVEGSGRPAQGAGLNTACPASQ